MGKKRSTKAEKKEQQNQQQQKQKQQQQQQKSQKQKKKKQYQQQQQQNPNVSEATTIRIKKMLQEFCESDHEAYTFNASFSNPERAVVHELSRKMGILSRSFGRGTGRRVTVYKKKRKLENINNEKEIISHFNFSEESQEVLQDLFMRYPPEDGEMRDKLLAEYRGDIKRHRHQDDTFRRPLMSKADIKEKVDSLTSRIKNTDYLRQIDKERSKLPIASFKDNITSTVESHQVVLISGETGCGKTTQVPQYLLDHNWGKGKACKIICAQPRRVSATSVAERIAHERGESIGVNIGYKIRLESKGGRHSSILFCTNGILLRVLVSRGTGTSEKDSSNSQSTDISEISHIIVDEIHERDHYSDFMLAILRDMLPLYPHLRLILMSATLDAERYSRYFGGCPIIRVPGFTYPVKTFYLEDVLSVLKLEKNDHLNSTMLNASTEYSELTEEDKETLDEAIHLAWTDDDFESLVDVVFSAENPKIYNYQHSLTGLTPLMVFAGKGRVADVSMLLSLGADCHIQAKDRTTALMLALKENHQEVSELIQRNMDDALSNSIQEQRLLDKYLSAVNPEFIDVILIEQLLRKICIDSEEGAILVFFPGWDEINKTRERLLSDRIFKDESKFLIIPLHSMVPFTEQKKVFKRPPPGCRKIVLSTNIAETAITIDDVVYVIDSGRMKEKSYDPYNNVSTLQSSWISKASVKQREGRAGRCRPGICYHLFSRVRAESLPEFQLPEIKRMPIEELCLQIKLLDPYCKIEDFLGKTLDPPLPKAIHNAITVLQDIGALTHDEKLTDLGEKLGRLPVHPLTSKMIFFAILVNCLDPALTLACAADYRDPFTLPMFPEDRKKAAAAKSELASLYGGQSDQLAVIAAFDCWKKAKERGVESRFCSQYFISKSTMSMLNRMRKQLLSELVNLGFVSGDVSLCSLNAHDPGILHAVVVTGLYPRVGTLGPAHPKKKQMVVETASGAKVRLHPQSINFNLSSKNADDHPLIVYDEVTRGDHGMHIRNCTIFEPLPLLLLATEIAVVPAKDDNDNSDNNGSDDDDNTDDNIAEEGMEMGNKSREQKKGKVMCSPGNSVTVVVDRWLSLGSLALDVAQIYCLRERLTAAILFKVTHPRKYLPPVLGDSMYAIACVLSYDGCPAISLPLESTDSLTSTINSTEVNGLVSQQGGTTAPKLSSFLKSLIGHKSDQSNPRCSNVTEAPADENPVMRPDASSYINPVASNNPLTQPHVSHTNLLPAYENPLTQPDALSQLYNLTVALALLNAASNPDSLSQNNAYDCNSMQLPAFGNAADQQVPLSQCNPPDYNVAQVPPYSSAGNLHDISGYNVQVGNAPSCTNPNQKLPSLEKPVSQEKPSSKKKFKRQKPKTPSKGKPLVQDPNLDKNASCMNGPYGPRGDSFKRQRGNGS